MAEIEKHSETWRAVTEWAIAQVREATLQLSAIGVSERAADVLRGKIWLASELAGLTDPKIPDPIIPSPEY